MSKNTLLALAAFITSLANDTEASAPAAPAEAGGEAPPKRGRPPGKAAEPAKEPEPEKAKGHTIEELRAAIKPLVEDSRGDEVKALIKKHGGENLSSIPAEKHAAFLKDVDALAM